MKIVHINPSGDPAGVSWLLHEAMLKEGYHSRHIIYSPNHVHIVQQGQDIIYLKNPEKADKIIEEADILHINGYIRGEIWKFNGKMQMNLDKHLKKKKFVFHNHGGSVLLNVDAQLKEVKSFNKDFKFVACSPLTKLIYKNTKWLPNICPIDSKIYKPVPRNFKGKIMVCHKTFSPDVKPWKGTDVIEDTVNRLKNEFKFPIHFKWFHSMKISECLKESAHYHICIDNITQGFIGMSGWESLAKGQVVLSRLHPVVEKAYKKFGKGTCPIINVSGMDEMAKVLRYYCDNRDALFQKCKESYEWMQKYYTPKRVVELYIELYDKILKEDKNE